MSIDAWLIHTCTIERSLTYAEDDYNAALGEFGARASGVRCRMVVKMVQMPLGLGENPVIPSYRLFLPAGTDINEGDRVVDVLDEQGESLGTAWDVQQVLVRRSRYVKHITAHVERRA